MMTIQRVPDLRSQVYDRLKEKVRNGDYPEDTRFMEHAIAREFMVSRTPAREALALLARDGILVQHGRGFLFTRYTRDDLEELFELRSRLEPYAVLRVAETASDADLRALHELAMREFEAHRDSSSYVEANARVRDALFALCGNVPLKQAIERHEDQIAYIRWKTLRSPAIRRVSIAGFTTVIEAVTKRDGPGAEQAMAVLLNAARDAIIAEIEGSKVPPKRRKRS